MGPVPWVDSSSRTVWAAWTWSVAALRPTAARCRPGWAFWWRCNPDPGTCWSGSDRRYSPPPHRQKPWPSRAERTIRIREAALTPWATPSSRAWSPWYWAAALGKCCHSYYLVKHSWVKPTWNPQRVYSPAGVRVVRALWRLRDPTLSHSIDSNIPKAAVNHCDIKSACFQLKCWEHLQFCKRNKQKNLHLDASRSPSRDVSR